MVGTHPLRDEVKEFGFAIIPDVISREEVTAILTALEREIRSHRAGFRNMLACDAVRRFVSDSRLLGIAKAVLGDRAFPFRATLFEKSQNANWIVTWHQDKALPMKRRQEKTGWGPWSQKAGVIYALAPASAMDQILALRVHFDESSHDNGPLRVLAKTHEMGVLAGDTIDALAAKKSPQECLIGIGGVIAMRPLLIHASSKSRVTALRRVLHVEYAANEILDGDMELASA